MRRNNDMIHNRNVMMNNNVNTNAKTNNKTTLIYPPDYIDINLPSGVCSATELAVNKKQKLSAVPLGFDCSFVGYNTSKYGCDSWWGDDGFLTRMDDEFNRLHSFNHNTKAFMVEMNEKQTKTNKKLKGLMECNEQQTNRNVQTLLDENRKLKGEIEEWKAMHSKLYKFACDKIVNDDDIQML
eukprot:253691_1